jgi:hypothetical protein
MKNQLVIFFKQKHLILLFVCWAIIQFALLYHYGIITSNEAVKYTREAHNILAGKSLSEQKYIFYSAYILIHLLFIKLGCEITGVYIFQLLINLIATYFFYKTALNISRSKSIALLAALLLIICIPFQYWTVCLYTESFFCSLVIIFMYCLFGMNNSNRAKYLIAALILMLLVFSRPTGIFFIGALGITIFYKLLANKKFVVAIVGSLLFIAGFILLLNYEMNSAASYNFIKPYLGHNVICDVPLANSINQPNIYGTGINEVLSYVRNNPSEFLRLCGMRFISFWSLTRSFYTSAHNWMLRLFFYPLYIFAIISIIKQWKLKCTLMIFCVSVITIFTVSVMLTCDEWSNRFIMPLIPIVIFLAAYGIIIALKKKTSNTSV